MFRIVAIQALFSLPPTVKTSLSKNGLRLCIADLLTARSTTSWEELTQTMKN